VQLAELSPHLVRVAGAGAGAILGVAAGKLADVLPRRYGITQLATGAAKKKRNVVLRLGSAVIALGIAHVLLGIAQLSVASAAILFASNATVAAVVLAAAAIDVEHMILPLELTIGGTLLCVASSPARSVGLAGSAIGAVICFAVTFLPFLAYKKLRGQSGMGMGDAHLAVLGGAWHGAIGGVVVIFAGALQSAIAAALMRVLGIRYEMPASVKAEIAALRDRAAAGDEEAKAELADDPMAAEEREGTLGMRLPLGPFLALACVEILFARRYVVDTLVAFLQR
jgi:leader peptidase (prepilin peptidase)/N-methyltransferase